MKQFLTVVQGRKFLLSISLTLSAIWIMGPYIAIAGKMPFATMNYRLLASVFAGLFFFIMEYYRGGKFINNDETLPVEIKQELQTLQKALIAVLKTLHSNAIRSLISKYKKPWYVVLGPTNAGKTTLLTKAELNLKGLDQLPPMTITPTKHFNWWLADDAVFIDVGGKYLKDTNQSDNFLELLFKGFTKLLKRYRSFKPINGLILTINLQELTINTREQFQLKKLRQIVNELVSSFSNLPIYLLITRCDTIDGFTEYFEDLGQDERNQIFGFRFPLTTQSHCLPQLFSDEFNALLTRLNERVLWRLHQEHNLDKIGKIKNFPLQMECLKHPLAKLLNVVLPSTNVNLRGIFFTSSFQKDTPFDNLTKNLSRAYDLHTISPGHRPTQSKAFFIGELFKRIILQEDKLHHGDNSNQRLQLITSTLIVLITSACIYSFIHSYQDNLDTINKTQIAIHRVNQQHPSGNEHALIQRLNLLQTIIGQLTHQEGPWYKQIGMHQTYRLVRLAKQNYDSLLTTQFLTYLQRTLEIQLQNTSDDNSHQLYATLKAYLMLGSHQHFDKKTFTAWFDSYWLQLDEDPKTRQSLQGHLLALFENKVKELPINNQLIETKRFALNSMPQSRLVLTLLQNQYQRSPIKIMPVRTFKVLNSLPLEIPGIYNIVNFKNVYYNQIMNTCREITNGDWVLGKKPQNGISEIMLNQLSSEVQAIYLNEYAVTWYDIFNKIKFDQFENLQQINEIIDLLNNPQSPLIQLINIIKNNTQPLSDSIEFSQQVSSRFLMLNSLSGEMLKNSNQANLIGIRDYLNKINHAPDQDHASYDAAKDRMENQGSLDAISLLLQQSHTLPEPLQTWHTTIAAESWRLVLRGAQNYLNRIWVSTVYPHYATVLDQRYPLYKESPTDVALNDFATFFGNGGTMDVFFKNYLQPFVDNSRLYWEWKNIDGQRLNIPQTTLEMFIRAALIQKMFFPEESRTPSITFSLVPIELDPGVQSFSLDVEGQTLLFQKDNEQIISLSWPGPQPNHSDISLTDDQGKKATLNETGPWSWFKILDKSRLEGTTSPKHFKLSFDLNGKSVHYELYTNGIVNPFIPGILNAFRCPPNL